MDRLESTIYRIIYYGLMKPLSAINNFIQHEREAYYLEHLSKLEGKMLEEIQDAILKELKDDVQYYQEEGNYYKVYNSGYDEEHGYAFQLKDFISNPYPSLHVRGSNKYSQLMWKLFLKDQTSVQKNIYFKDYYDHIQRYFHFWNKDVIFDPVKYQNGPFDNEGCFRVKLKKKELEEERNDES